MSLRARVCARYDDLDALDSEREGHVHRFGGGARSGFGGGDGGGWTGGRRGGSVVSDPTGLAFAFRRPGIALQPQTAAAAAAAATQGLGRPVLRSRAVGGGGGAVGASGPAWGRLARRVSGSQQQQHQHWARPAAEPVWAPPEKKGRALFAGPDADEYGDEFGDAYDNGEHSEPGGSPVPFEAAAMAGMTAAGE